MGGNCCACTGAKYNSELLVPSKDNDAPSDRFIIQKDFLPDIDISTNTIEAFQFLISDNFYLLLIKGSSHYLILYKVTMKLSIKELVTLIENILDYIKDKAPVGNKLISDIKENLDFGLKYPLAEIKERCATDNENNKSTKNFMSKAIAELCIIIHFIKFTNEQKTNFNYKVNNFWKGKKVEESLNLNSYNACHFLIQAKACSLKISISQNSTKRMMEKSFEVWKDIYDNCST